MEAHTHFRLNRMARLAIFVIFAAADLSPSSAFATKKYDGVYDGENTVVSALAAFCQPYKYQYTVKDDKILLSAHSRSDRQTFESEIDENGNFIHVFYFGGGSAFQAIEINGNFNGTHVIVNTTSSWCKFKYFGEKIK